MKRGHAGRPAGTAARTGLGIGDDDEFCPACGALLERTETTIRCSSGRMACPVRGILPRRTMGNVFDGLAEDERSTWAALTDYTNTRTSTY